MADLDQLHTALINADKAGDTEAAKALAGEIMKMRGTPAIEAAKPADPTGTFTQNLGAGIGKAFVDTGRGARQILSNVPGLNKLDTFNPEKVNAEVAQAREEDAPLMKTGGGITGNIAGNVALAAPTMLIPGANTYTGSALTGAALSALQPVTEGESRLKNTAMGGTAGIVAKAGGDTIGNLVSSRLQKKTAEGITAQAQNAQKDATLATSRDAGYVVPPSQTSAGPVDKALEGFAGKISTAQKASIKNQDVTNKLVRGELNLAEDAPITKEALSAIRTKAGGAYDKLKKVGTFKPDDTFRNELAGLSGEAGLTQANPEINTLVNSLNKEELGSGQVVTELKRLRFHGGKNLNNMDPLKVELGRAQLASAESLENLIERNLETTGQKQLLTDFQKARVEIAKSYSVENALNDATGNVSAQKLSKQLTKGKPLSGGLKTAGQFAQAYPKAAQDVTSSMPGVSPLDFAAVGGISAAAGNPGLLATLAGRPAARSLILSKMYQNGANPSYGPGNLLKLGSGVANNKALRAMSIPAASQGAFLYGEQ